MLGIFNKSDSDEALMLKYQQGDSRAFETLYARHKDQLYAYLYRSHVDLAIIEEIAQESWLAIIKSAENYRASASFRTYLYAIAHRKLVDFWRKNKYWNLEDSQDENGQALTESLPASDRLPADSIDLSMDLLLALEKLSKEQQQAFLLREEGFSRKEIAVMMESSEETIKSRLRYASKHLQNWLEVQYAN